MFQTECTESGRSGGVPMTAPHARPVADDVEALAHARWHRALEDPSTAPGPIEDHIRQHDARVRADERERIAQAMPEAVADRVTWDDGTEYIAVADAQKIARKGGQS